MESFYEEPKNWDNALLHSCYSFAQEQIGEGVMAEAHVHDYIEIIFCLAGKIKIFIDGTCHDFHPGDMVLVNTREVHYILGQDQRNKYIVVKFEPEVLYTTSNTIFEAKYLLPFTLKKSTHQRLFTHDEIKDTCVPALIYEIFAEYEQRNYGFELAVYIHICRIFLWILRDWKEKGLDFTLDSALNESTMERLQKIFDYVTDHYQHRVSVKEAAKLCNMSYSNFSRFFKSVMKRNFNEYLNYVRVTAAEKLLTTTDLNVTEIALEVGFSTSSYFVSQFRNYRSITPKQYRTLLSLKIEKG